MTIANYDVKRYLIDNGCSTDIIFYDYFLRMQLSINRLKLVNAPLIRFTDDSVKIKGEIKLLITVGWPPRQSIVQLNFFVVRVPSAYNIILRRSELNALWAIISTYHLLVHFPMRKRINEIKKKSAVGSTMLPNHSQRKKASWSSSHR